jgi:hypothetical protein
MQNISEILNESLMDDFDVMMQAAENGKYDNYFEQIINDYPKNEAGKDAFGRKVEAGDWVVCIPPGGKAVCNMTFGVVKKVTPKKFTILVKSNLKQMSWNAWTKRDAVSKESVMTISCNPSQIFKIVDKDDFIQTLG